MDFVIINGEIIRKEEANLTVFIWENPFVFHHKSWFGFGGIPLFFENLALLKEELEIFGAEIPQLFNQHVSYSGLSNAC